ncbi:bile acid:sodium symporter family protein [Neptunomonas sp.]|uniref:bile acid:sodium symporter family protein n=1 Tax=Neptunomonas sp. TaxID=1971898 RepID=UPI003563B8FD
MVSTGFIQIILPLALFLIMLGIGLSLSVNDFLVLKAQPRAVVVGSLMQLVGLPIVGYAVVTVMNLPPVYAVGMMILTFAPGGATSNMISYLCKADTALSVSLTVIASVLTPFTLPLLSFWAVTHWLSVVSPIPFPVVQTMLKLLAIALVPVLLGMWIHKKMPCFASKLQPLIKWSALLFMLVVVTGIVVANKDKLSPMLMQVGPAVMLLSITAMLAGAWIGKRCRFSSQQCMTLAIETGIQNAGLALVITGAVLDNTEMSGVVLLYGVLMQIPALVLIAYRQWSRKQAAVVSEG